MSKIKSLVIGALALVASVVAGSAWAETITDARWGNMGAAPSTPGVTTGTFGDGNYQNFTLNFTTTDNISATEIGSAGSGFVKIKKITLVKRSNGANAALSKVRLTQGNKTAEGTVEIKADSIVIYGSQFPGNSGDKYTQKQGYYVATFTSDVEFDVTQNITLQLLNSSGTVANHGLRMIKPGNSVLVNSGYSPAIEIVGDYTTRMYSNKLATDDATVPAGTYGDIVVPDYGYKATAFTAKTKITGGEGSYDKIQYKVNNNNDTQTHTVSGWFKVSAYDRLVYTALAYTGGDHGGYKVYCNSSGNLEIGKCNGNNLNWNGNKVTAQTALQVDTWYYLTFAITKNDADRNAKVAVFVNGSVVYEGTDEFATNLNGSNCIEFDIGAGVSAAGLYIDTTAVKDVATIKNWATNKSLVEAVPARATATLTEPKNWSDIVWQGPVTADSEYVVTFEGGSLNINQNVDCAAIKFKGAAIVSAGEFTFPAIDASGADSLTVNGGTVEFAALPSGNITIAKDATLKFDVSTATTINGIAGEGTFLKTGSAELTLNNISGGYAIDGTTIQIDGGNIKLNCGVNGITTHGNNADAKVKDATFILGANSNAKPISQYGWYDFYGTTTFENATDKTLFGGGSLRAYEGFELVKRGAGTLTFDTSYGAGNHIKDIKVEAGKLHFNNLNLIDTTTLALDFSALDKTATPFEGNFTLATDTSYKFPAGWNAGDVFKLCSGTLSGIPSGGKISNFKFYVGGEEKTADFNLSSDGSVYYSTGVVPVAPEGNYAISTLNDEEIGEGQTVELTMNAGATLTIDAVAKAATSVLCDGILLIEGADGAEPTAEQLAALNFEGVTGTIVKKWLATMSVINVNFVSGKGAFVAGDTSDDGMLAGNTPKSSWINVGNASGSTTEITKWDTMTQTSASVSGMTVAWNAKTVWEAGQDIPVLVGYLDDGDKGTWDNGVTITLTGVPFKMYDVIVYFNTDVANRVYPPVKVNNIAYTWDSTEGKTVVGTANWGATTRSGAAYGKNALRIADLSGNITINTAPRDDAQSLRGCVPAIQIVEVPAKEYRTSYEAEAGKDVTTSFLNSYIAEGDTYTGPFTLTLNGGKFIADADFVCAALAINSATDLTIEKAESYEIPATEVAKIAINEFSGDKITYVNLPTVPATAPAEGKTYRWEGTESLATLPFAGVTVAGTLEIACPIADGAKIEIANSHNEYVFEDGFSLTAQQLIIGNNRDSVQHFTQNGGTITLTKEYTSTAETTTDMPFLLAHWPSTCTYDLVGGSIIVENGNVMFGRDGTIAMTVGGGETTATFKARGISRNGRDANCPLTIAENGILQLGVGGIDFVNSGNKKLILAGGKIEIYDDATIATTAATEVTDDSTIDIAADKTLTLATTFTGEGTITITGEGTLNLGTTRPDFSKFDFGENVKLVFVESVADDGVIDISGLNESQISLLDTEGNPKSFTLSGGKMTYTPSVAGKAAWLAYEFEGNLISSGSDTSGLTRDGSDFGADASLDFKDGMALYTGTHPYRDITYPSSWTCALFGTLPQYQNAVLVTFGTRNGGLIGLATGDPEKNEVLLVRTTGNKKFEVVSTMTVPNAFTAKNLYAFVKDGNTINVYLNGMKWGLPYTADAINFGGGLQIASVHGGVGSTQLVRFDKNLFGGDINNEILRASVIDSMRLYKAALGPNAMAVLAEEFPYISPNGSFERTVAEAEENWVAEDAWTKVGEEGAFEKPADNSSVTITTGAADTALTINLDGTVDYEALTFNGTGTLTLKKGTGLVVNDGQTKVNAPIVIEYGAAEITGGPTFINGNGKILFDYSAYPIDEVFGGSSIQLTGLIDEQDEGIVDATFPEDLKGRTMEIVYEAGAYWIKIGVDRKPTMLYLTVDTTLDDYTRFALSESGEATELRLLEDDTIVVPTGKALTIPETGLAIPAKAVIGAGTIVCDGYLPNTITTLQTTDWTGTLYLKNYDWQSFGFGAYGTADSKIKVTGITGFGPSSTGDGVNPELILEDGDAKALLINNGFSNKDYFFRKVSGSGTFGWDPSATKGPGSGQTYIFKDISDFDGVFDTGAFLKIVVGDTTAGTDKGSITFANGITVKTGLGWTAQKAYFGETLTVKGAVGDVLVEGLTTAPDPLPAITLVGEEEGDYMLKYDDGKLVVSYADVTFTVAPIDGATAAFEEGYVIDEDGSVTVPYGATATLVYTANEGKLFNDGKTTVTVLIENITDAATAEATIAAAIEGKSTADAKAKIGTKLYLTLADAINAVGDEATTVIAIGNQTLTEKLEISGKTITLDGDNAFITITGQLRVVNGADVTIGSYITLTSDKHPTVFVRGETAKSTLTINGFVYNTNEEFDATFTISGNGSDAAGADIIVNGYVVNYNGAAIYFPQPGTLTLTENAMVQGYSAIIMKDGTLNIAEGAAVYASGETYIPLPLNRDGATPTGDAIVAGYYPESYGYGTPVLNITAGTFTTTASEANGVNGYDHEAAVAPAVAKGNILISGGTFDKPVNPAYCQAGFIPADDGSGNYGVKHGFYLTYVSEYGTAPATKTVDATEVESTWQYALTAEDLPNLGIDTENNKRFVEWDKAVGDVITADTTLTATWEEAEVEVVIPTVDGAMPTVEGYEIKDGKVSIPYGSDLTVVYTANENKLFSDGTTTKEFSYTNVTADPQIDVSGISTVDAAAKIGTVYYLTLADAFTAAPAGSEIELLADVELDKCIAVDKKVTLNIGEFDVTPKCAFTQVSKDALFAVRYGGDFTVIGTTGCIDSSSIESIYSAIKLTEKGETSDGTTRAKLTVNANLKGYYYGICGNGNRGYTDIVVNGGTITAAATDTNVAIFNPQPNSTLVINDGTITGLDSAVEIRGGSLTVNGGTLTATSETYEIEASGSGNTTKGAAVAVAQHTTKGDIAVEIAGGTLNGLKAVSVTNPQENDTTNVAVELGEATYEGELAFDADGNATVTNNGATIAAPAGYVWGTDGKLTKAAAKIGTAYYLTLADAVSAADGTEDIVLLADSEGNGITINKSITIDFNTFTYTVTGAPAGSTGTKSQAFQILKEAGAVEFKNGTITSTDVVKMLVNNYTDLTLTGMTLDGTNMGVAHKAGTEIEVPNYTLSNNNGTTTLTGGTVIISKGAGHFAMDTYDSTGYEGVPTVIVDGATIDGDVELSGGNLDLDAGTLTGKLVDGGIGNGVITKADAFVADAPAGYVWKDGVLTKATAKIGTAYYLTLAEAIDAVQAHETIELLADMTIGGISIPSGKNFVLEFNEKTITFECPGAGSAGTKTIGFQILKDSTIIFQNGTIQCSEANKDATWTKDSTEKGIAMMIQNYANLSLENMTIDGTNIAHNGVATRYVMSNNSGTVSIYDTTIKAAEGDFAFDTCKYGKYDLPTITVDGSTYYGSSIEGNVELSGGNLNLVKGAIDGELVDGGIGDGVIIKGAAFDVVAPDGYVWNDEGYLIKASAKIGSIFYLTLADAVKAATGGNTVELLASCTGDGIKIDKSITIDFGGFVYTVDASLVGSPSTQSQAFNLVRGNTITLKNGTITSKVARMLVQNYASLTLEDMILDGSELAAKNGKGNDYVAYTLSNCAGDTVITGDTVISARVLEGQKSFAFDTYYQAGKYEDATVTVNGDVTIMGDIELAGGSLTLTAGTLNGALVAGANIEKGIVYKEDTFEADAPAGYGWKDGVLTKATAKIGTTYYLTLAEAVTAADGTADVELLASCAGDGIKIDKSITIDFGGFVYTVDASLVGSPSTQSQAFNLVRGNAITLKNGTITSTVARMLVQNYASLTLEDMILDGTNLAAKNGKGNDYVAYTLSNCAGDTVIKGNSVIKARVLDGQTSFAFDTYYQAGKYEDATVTVNGATIDGDVELAGGSLTLTAGTLNGELVAGANIEKGIVYKEDTFEAAAPEGYEWKEGLLVASYPEAKVEPTTVEGFDVAFIYTAMNDAPLYNDAVASFVITPTTAVPADTIKIGGKFATMGWNIFNLPAIGAGESYTIVEATWAQVKAISPFTCGAASIALEKDTEITLTLKLGDDVIDTKTVTLKAVEPFDPEVPKTYDTPEAAQKAAEIVNANKLTMINIPTVVPNKQAYVDLFEAVADGTTVTVQFTEDAKDEIAEELKDADAAATILTPDEEGKATFVAKPGLWYGIKAEGSFFDIPAAEGQNWAQAAGEEVKIVVPVVTDDEGVKAKAAFFQPTCSAKDPTK